MVRRTAGRRRGLRPGRTGRTGVATAGPEGAEPAWHLYVVRAPAPDALSEALQAEGIGARGYYRVPTHEQPAMREFRPDVALPGTEEAAQTNLA
ncbi:MAG TPA: DegT/DnrJ/EryC1/StrS family aminotransferase, partial [Solirubrobacteraceae bacterium]